LHSQRITCCDTLKGSISRGIEVLEEFKGSSLNGVFHAFSGSIKDAERAIGLGFKLGIGVL